MKEFVIGKMYTTIPDANGDHPNETIVVIEKHPVIVMGRGIKPTKSFVYTVLFDQGVLCEDCELNVDDWIQV